MNRWRRLCHTNNKQKRVGMAIIISDQIDFNPKIASKDKRHYILIKYI